MLLVLLALFARPEGSTAGDHIPHDGKALHRT